MANTIKIKRSAVQGKIPATADLQLGELAVNTYDGKLFLKKDNGTEAVVEIGGGGTTPAATVTAETSYGQAAAVGTSTAYARADHTHGTPASDKDTTAVTGLLKGDGTTISAAVAGTDYMAATKKIPFYLANGTASNIPLV